MLMSRGVAAAARADCVPGYTWRVVSDWVTVFVYLAAGARGLLLARQQGRQRAQSHRAGEYHRIVNSRPALALHASSRALVLL